MASLNLPATRRIAVAVSGGVDSLCALLLLRRQKADVLALHGLFLPDSSAPSLLEEACHALGVELVCVNLSRQFQSAVISPFARAWLSGRTPNPCVACNRHIKFGALLKSALALGADMLATGHYAEKRIRHDRALPASAADASREQSYFLGNVKPEKFQRAIFPLARLKKNDCRAIVASAGLAVPHESRDICFAGKDWHAFMQGLCGPDKLNSGAGPVVLVDESGQSRVIAQHNGNLWRYTVGQRKGLGIPFREPLFVLGKDMLGNTLFVATAGKAQTRIATATDPNIFLDPQYWPDTLYAKLRYRQKPEPCRATICGNEIHMEFEKPRWPPAPGQLAVLYNAEGEVLAAGILK